MEELGLKPIVPPKVPTHKKGDLLDQIYTNG